MRTRTNDGGRPDRGGARSVLVAAAALALPYTATLRHVLLPAATPGLLVGLVLGIGRAVAHALARAGMAAGDDPERLEAEIGDLLFSVVNLARHREVDAEGALRRAGARFERRFRALESRIAADGRRADDLSLEQLEAYWCAVKADE